MAYFPMCMDLTGKTVLLVGCGPQIHEKAKRLAPFGAELIHVEKLKEETLEMDPVFVVAGDLSEQEAKQAAALCAAHRVPINVVDRPHLCTFLFPALIVRGELTVSISTGGSVPGAASCLKAQIAQSLPEKTEDIIRWLSEVRTALYQTHTAPECAERMREITAAAFAKGDVLSPQEWLNITGQAE